MSEQNFNIIRGDDWERTLTFTDANGDAIDITGWTIFLTLKTKAQMEDSDDTNAALQKDITSHSDPTNGITAVTMTDEETDDLQGKYNFDMQYKKDDGTIGTFLSGFMTFKRDVTIRTS